MQNDNFMQGILRYSSYILSNALEDESRQKSPSELHRIGLPSQLVVKILTIGDYFKHSCNDLAAYISLLFASVLLTC